LLGGLWLVLGIALTAVTSHARDWFDMTDELRYERLAISIARSHSLVPRIHGVDIHSFSQLYPLLLATVFAHGLVPHDLTDAHVLNAWLMSSACIPTWLLARPLAARSWVPLLAAALAVFMPWILYSTMLMTENAAYPAFLWAVLGLQHTLAHPSRRADCLALLGLALAFFARTELLVLAFVAPVAALVLEAGRLPLRQAPGAAVRNHRVLAAAYVALASCGLVLWRLGRLSDVFGVYGLYAHHSRLLPAGSFGSFAEHVSILAVGVGILPVLAGGAWLVANVVRPPAAVEAHAFACAAGVAVLGVLVQTTNFDVRYTGYVHDRFLLYLVPLFVIASLCAFETRLPLWSLAVPAALLIAGFVTGALPGFVWSQFDQLDPDSPISKVFQPLVHLTGSLDGARALLTVATLALTALLALFGGRGAMRAACVVLLVVAIPATTVFVFARFFDSKDWALRPVTASQTGVFDTIDAAVGRHASVSMIPYPIDSDYFISQQRWWDLEFWNESIERDVHLDPQAFVYTGIWFPKLDETVDAANGRLSASPTRWVAQSDKETRLQISGPVKAVTQDVMLIDAGPHWRADWISFGLYDDGWTKPKTTARFRIFARPGQKLAELRYLSILTRPPDDVARAPVTIRSNLGTWTGTATNTGTLAESVRVCVPPRGWTEVRLATPLDTSIPGDLDSLDASTGTRRGGLYLAAVALAGEVGGRCRPNGSGARP
jgi:hypothetical protein